MNKEELHTELFCLFEKFSVFINKQDKNKTMQRVILDFEKDYFSDLLIDNDLDLLIKIGELAKEVNKRTITKVKIKQYLYEEGFELTKKGEKSLNQTFSKGGNK